MRREREGNEAKEKENQVRVKTGAEKLLWNERRSREEGRRREEDIGRRECKRKAETRENEVGERRKEKKERRL